jgi:hypothetical protein
MIDKTIKDLEATQRQYQEWRDFIKQEVQKSKAFFDNMNHKESSMEQKALAFALYMMQSDKLWLLRSDILVLRSIRILATDLKLQELQMQTRTSGQSPQSDTDKAETVKKIKELKQEIANLRINNSENQPYIESWKEQIDRMQRYFDDHR